MASRTLLFTTFVLALAAGCGEDEPTGYDTYQACFDELNDFGRGLTVPESILECCLSHPIAGEMPACGADKPACINYLTINLEQTSASTVEVQDTCTTYADQL